MLRTRPLPCKRRRPNDVHAHFYVATDYQHQLTGEFYCSCQKWCDVWFIYSDTSMGGFQCLFISFRLLNAAAFAPAPWRASMTQQGHNKTIPGVLWRPWCWQVRTNIVEIDQYNYSTLSHIMGNNCSR